ncbi:MAG: ceramidase domain-containing protein [Bacteroidia bacterium]
MRTNTGRILILITLLAISVIMLAKPIAQDLSYHAFADARSFFGINNFGNVISNLPFLIAACLGLYYLSSQQVKLSREQKMISGIFFFGMFITSFGSAWYHYNPNNNTLVYDRGSMTIAFMAFFCYAIGIYHNEKIALKLLVPLILLGIGSVYYWHLTELSGHGDLRPYGLVQFLPMVLILVMLILSKGKKEHTPYILIIALCYAVAKVCEAADIPIYKTSGFVSGHTLKHLIASAVPFLFLTWLKKTNSNV